MLHNRVHFLFPGSSPFEALDNWALTIARHCQAWRVSLSRWPQVFLGEKGESEADYVFLITEGKNYPRDRIDADIAFLRERRIKFGVVHNNDNPGVPTPGDYPSFVWTQQAEHKLDAYKPILLRQPVLPFCVVPKQRPLHIGTFGYVEEKKETLQMAHWAATKRIPFTAFCPDVSVMWCPDRIKLHEKYAKMVAAVGGTVIMHPWAARIEDLAPLVEDISHFLFVLPPSKGGKGGSPTSPRFATAFARPVMVVDDEGTMREDRIHVYSSLEAIPAKIDDLLPPVTVWGPEQYVGVLVELTDRYWRANL